MPRRGENIYKRKDGRWEGRILNIDGTYKYVYDKSYKGVKEKKKQYQEKSKGNRKSIARKSTVDLFESWLTDDANKQVKPSTYEYYYNCMYKYILPFFSNIKYEKITVYAVSEFVNSIKDNISLSESYKIKILSVFKTALKKVIKDSAEYLTIMEVIKFPSIQNTEINVFTTKEQLLVEDTVMHFPDKKAIGILLCYYTGIRLGEICALKWNDIDFDSKTISITKTVSRIKNFRNEGNKTFLLVGTPKSRKSTRKIPLPDFLLNIGQEFRIFENEDKYIFTGTDLPLDPRVLQKLYKKLLIKAGVKYRKFHAIRHTFATRALELGVDIKTLSEILGHSNVSITLNVYAHSLVEQKRIAINKLNEMHVTFMKDSSIAVKDSVRLNEIAANTLSSV